MCTARQGKHVAKLNMAASGTSTLVQIPVYKKSNFCWWLQWEWNKKQNYYRQTSFNEWKETTYLQATWTPSFFKKEHPKIKNVQYGGYGDWSVMLCAKQLRWENLTQN